MTDLPVSSIRFRGLIAPEGVPTGDNRGFDRNSLTHRPLPLPVMFTRDISQGHMGATTVGRLETIEYVPGHGWIGEGPFFDPRIIPEVTQAVYLIQQGVSSPSVDLEPALTMEIRPHPQRPDQNVAWLTSARIMGATFVPYPAFEQVSIIVGSERDEAILASAGVQFAINSTSWRRMPVADRDAPFDFDAAIPRLVEWSGASAAKFKQAFLYQIPDGDPTNVETYLLMIADVIDGQLTLIPRAVFSAATFLSGGHGGLPQIPDSDKEQLRGVVTDMYDMLRDRYGDLRLRPPWQRGGRQDARGANDTTPATFGSEQMQFAVNTSGWSDLPIASEDREWDESAARSALASWAGIDAEDAPRSAWNKYRRGFLWYDDSDPELKGSYKFPIATPVDGTLTIVPRAVNNAKARLNQANIPSEDMNRMEGILNAIQRRGGFGDPNGDDDSAASTQATTFQATEREECPEGKVWDEDAERCVDAESDDSDSGSGSDSSYTVLAAGVPARPPREWFDNPNLDRPTPLTVTDEGRVFGHLATWGECHVGIGNQCVTAPHSNTNYAYFRTGEAVCADGSRVSVGKITLGTGHADPQLGYIPAAEHYDNTGAVVAVVVPHEDQFGPVMAGAVVPGVDEQRLAELRRSPLSGDWRRVGGNLELVAALAVNNPGFPVVRASGEQQLETLLAASVVTEPGEPASHDDRAERLASIDAMLRQERIKSALEE